MKNQKPSLWKRLTSDRNLTRFQAMFTVCLTITLFSPVWAQGTNPLEDIANNVMLLFEGIAALVVAIGIYKIGMEYINGGSMTKDHAYKMLIGGGLILTARPAAEFINQ